MKKRIISFGLALLLGGSAFAQPAPQTFREELSYFMPTEWHYTLDSQVPTPEQEMGFQVGSQHVNWEQVVAYMKRLAACSPRFSIQEYGRTFENRPLICVVITSEKNQKNLESLRSAHAQLADPAASVDPKSLPAVASVMMSIHGNEASGVNASLPFAYFFAAAQGPEIEALLDKTIITLIPGQNPDGITRFSTWVNSNRSLRNVTDPQSREFSEPWPGGRSNHYWHDLNRDWLNASMPEMKALLKIYHDWMPNTVNDHHEMGSSSTFFLEPADPVGYYPHIPQENKDLTQKVSSYNMAALDRIGSLYLSKDQFDSYSLGTGDVYGDALGSIAMLFEQASARGHQQETENGILNFPFAVRNHATTAFGSVKAAYEMREELNDYMHQFVVARHKEAIALPEKGYIFDGNGSDAVSYHFIEMLAQHDLHVNRLAKETTINGHTYDPAHAYVIPMDQRHSMLLRSLLECNTQFKDSLFYDLSTWNMAEAYGLKYAPLKSIAGLQGEAVTTPTFPKGGVSGKANYAYLFDNKEYYAPLFIKRLQDGGAKVKVSGVGLHATEGYQYGPGMLMVPVSGQKISADSLYTLIQKGATEAGITVRNVSSGQMKDYDLGHFYNRPVKEAKVAVLIGGRMRSNVAGSLWYLLDNRYQMQPTMLDESTLSRTDLTRYNVLILSGELAGGEAVAQQIANWVKAGGTLITIGSGYQTANKAKLTKIETIDLSQPDSATYVPYDKRSDRFAEFQIPGTDLQVSLDTTHPLCWGYTESVMPILKNSNLVFKMPKEANLAPVCYDKKQPLLSGFIRPEHLKALTGMPEVICQGAGKGQVICFADDPNFRSIWYAGTRLFMNAVLFGNLIRE
ncbi:peptidase M14 [Parabacteroides distasonis]|nr:peptidase M14 [Parabacteroides distasonis]